MSAKPSSLTAIVLAGQRDGALDPLAEAAGVRFKALAPVAGQPMILHVLEALGESGRVGQIIVSVNDGADLERLPHVAALIANGRLRIVPSRRNLVDSVLEALEYASFPVLVTTADNVLLGASTVAEIDDKARAANADVAVAMARRADVLAAHPEGQRKFYACADDAYSNCNSYWLGSRRALGPVEMFRTGGQFVKHPMRVVSALGLRGAFELVRFRFGLGSLDDAFRRLSRHFRLAMRAIVVTDGAVAIDVDNDRTRQVAEQVLTFRAAPAALAAE